MMVTQVIDESVQSIAGQDMLVFDNQGDKDANITIMVTNIDPSETPLIRIAIGPNNPPQVDHYIEYDEANYSKVTTQLNIKKTHKVICRSSTNQVVFRVNGVYYS